MKKHTHFIAFIPVLVLIISIAIFTGCTTLGGNIPEEVNYELAFQLKGHTDKVLDVAVTPDGKYAFSVGMDNTLRKWDLEAGTEVGAFPPHPDDIMTVAISPDGTKIATGARDLMVRVFDFDSGEMLYELKSHSDTVYKVGFSPSGSILASSGKDGTARLWDAETGELVYVLRGHGGEVYAFDFSEDEELLLTGSKDATIRVWLTAEGREIGMTRTNVPVYAVQYTPDEEGCIAAVVDKVRGDSTTGARTVAPLWLMEKNGNEFRRTTILGGHKGQTWDFLILQEGKYILSGGTDGMYRIWNEELGARKLLVSFKSKSGSIWGLDMSEDESLFAAACSDNVIEVYKRTAK